MKNIALVTGASSGIGKDGSNYNEWGDLIIVAREEELKI